MSSPPPTVADEPCRVSLGRGLWQTARPRQWVKNLLVLAAPGAAGVLLRPGVLARSLVATAVFCLAATGVYFLNDTIDRSEDRAHPDKRLRPIAAGTVPVRLAVAMAGSCFGAALVISALVLDARVAAALVLYGAINVGYSLLLKNEPVLDMAAVTSGFVIRAVVGGLVAQVALSNWFLIVASFGSLFVVAGKRQVDGRLSAPGRLTAAGAPTPGRRGVVYPLSYLQHVRSLAAAVTMTAYCLWAFEKARIGGHHAVWYQLTIVPFVLVMLRYSLLVEGEAPGAPEEIVSGDRTTLVLAAVWALLFAVGVYGS